MNAKHEGGSHGTAAANAEQGGWGVAMHSDGAVLTNKDIVEGCFREAIVMSLFHIVWRQKMGHAVYFGG